jgi:hypothetical protein
MDFTKLLEMMTQMGAGTDSNQSPKEGEDLSTSPDPLSGLLQAVMGRAVSPSLNDGSSEGENAHGEGSSNPIESLFKAFTSGKLGPLGDAITSGLGASSLGSGSNPLSSLLEKLPIMIAQRPELGAIVSQFLANPQAASLLGSIMGGLSPSDESAPSQESSKVTDEESEGKS